MMVAARTNEARCCFGPAVGADSEAPSTTDTLSMIALRSFGVIAFEYDETTKQIRNTPTNKCITLVGESTGGPVVLKECVLEEKRQRWLIHEPWWRRVNNSLQ